MIITNRDLAELNRHLEFVQEFDRIHENYADVPDSPTFLANRPHLIIPLGFDEYRAFTAQDLDAQEGGILGIERVSFDFDFESVYRKADGGAWYWLEGLAHEKLHFVGPGKHSGRLDDDYNVSVSEWLATIARMRNNPDRCAKCLWLPSLWTPCHQRQVRESLAHTVPDLLLAIQNEDKCLRDISPRELEELVAELLRSRGMDIDVTPYSRDGGRDIIARGELVPGEPTTIAIEVKQKPVVGLHDLQRALNANQDFPCLMVATAGRFSSGVVREKEQERNALRLILKDGVAPSQWINVYAQNVRLRNRP
jgi:hypothetical protein